MDKERLRILDVPFDRISLSEAVKKLDEACEKKQKYFCVTPNPEICLSSQKDKSFLKVLKSAQLSIPDGFGILWAARYLAGRKSFLRWLWTLFTPYLTLKFSTFPERVTGTDLMKSFCLKHKKRKIFLLGAEKIVNEKLADKLKNSGVLIVGNYSGNSSKKLEAIIRSMIDASQAEVLFVAFGAPKQEKWIYNNLPQLKSVKVAVGIGGAFDFLSGKRKRSPKWMRKVGLEWLYRLIIEPRRIKRILKATIVFPWKVLISGKNLYN